MKQKIGEKQAEALHSAMLDLVADFDDECTEIGLSDRLIDAHIAAILIDLLDLIVVERETFSVEELIEVTKRELWTSAGELPPVKSQPCPSCGSIDARTVHRVRHRLMLTCPTCTHQWEYGGWRAAS